MVATSQHETAPNAGGKAARTRHRLRGCTLDVIAETGEFTGEVVAERAGVSTATFFSHFATKDHAIAACLQQCFDEYDTRMQHVESVERLLDVGLEQMLADVVQTIIDINEKYRNLLRLARGRIQVSRLLRDISREEERRAFAATQRFLELGQAAGRIKPGDTRALTATVRTVLDGLDTWTVRADRDIARREIAQLLARYLAPSPT